MGSAIITVLIMPESPRTRNVLADSGAQGSRAVPISASRLNWRAKLAGGKFCAYRPRMQPSAQPKQDFARETPFADAKAVRPA
jgi:hypothetical protein